MSRRLWLLLGLLVGVPLFAGAEVLVFGRLGAPRAIFVQLAILGVLASLGVVLARNLVHAALFLVAFFFLVACQFILLEAEFMAAMQVLVYIGAVAILLMFGIMLTRNIQGDETTGGTWLSKLPAAVLGLGILGVLAFGILNQRGGPGGFGWASADQRPLVSEVADGRGRAISDMAPALGVELMTRWVIPFELAGLLLTAALVGAVALARSEQTDEPSSASNRGAARPTDFKPAPAEHTGGAARAVAAQPVATRD